MLLLKIENKIINAENITYAEISYKTLDSQGETLKVQEPVLTVKFIGGDSMSFNRDSATSLWEWLEQATEPNA